MRKTEEKIIGILGGMGPEATVDIFKKIVKLTKAEKDQDHFRIIIDNNPKIPDRTASIRNGDLKIVEYLCKTAKNLQRAGADFIIIPCNTAHYFVKDIEKVINIPIINMIKETVNAVKEAKIDIVGILATDGTIKTGLYQNEFSKIGINCVIPDYQSQKNIMNIISLVKKGFEKKLISKNLLYETKKLIEKKIDGIILGCTEIPLVFPYNDIKLPVFDATTILAKSAIKYAGGI